MNVWECVDKVLAFLPRLREAGSDVGHWVAGERGDDGVVTMGWAALGDDADALVRVCQDSGFTLQFDWGEWAEEAARYVDEPPRLAAADLETLRKLMTAHIRQDRFCDGHLLEMFKSGHILALLERLAEIRADGPRT